MQISNTPYYTCIKVVSIIKRADCEITGLLKYVKWLMMLSFVVLSEGFQSFMWKGLTFVLPFLVGGYVSNISIKYILP